MELEETMSMELEETMESLRAERDKYKRIALGIEANDLKAYSTREAIRSHIICTAIIDQQRASVYGNAVLDVLHALNHKLTRRPGRDEAYVCRAAANIVEQVQDYRKYHITSAEAEAMILWCNGRALPDDEEKALLVRSASEKLGIYASNGKFEE